MGKDYGSWSLVDLKSELRKRNAKLTGKKAVLVQRLEDYDKLFGQLVTDPESVYKIVVPSAESFRDVTSDSIMPVLAEDDLKTFSVLAERENLATSQNMYMERFLISCRSAKKDCDYYITGLCASEMRKSVSYNVTIKAKDHIVLEAQCECAAGLGPCAQCKHVLVVLYGVVDFNKSKTIRTKSSCTSRLQTFHHPKAMYSGDPVQAENLKLKFKDSKLKQITKFDPRPTGQNAEKYRENFNSLIANYCAGQKTMPIAQLIKPADKQTIYRDHDYLEKTAEEQFFESLILNEQQLNSLQMETSSNRKMWLEQRKFRLQSSDFGKICKQKTNQFKLAKSLLQSNEIHAPAIKHGIKYEKCAIKKFQELTGLSVSKCGIIVHPEHQFLGCTPDALVENDEVLEVKCPYTARNEKISVEIVPYLYLCEETGNFKLIETHDYYYQIQGQMFCSRRNVANFLIYTLCDCYLIKVPRNYDFIKQMFQGLKHFYDNFYKKEMLNKFLYLSK